MSRKARVAPKFEPTQAHRKIVRERAGFGVPQADIAAELGISVDTLSRHFAEEYKAGVAKANLRMARSLFAKGIKGDTTAMIFWLKTRARWRDSGDPEESDPPPAPVKIIVQVVDARKREVPADADA